MSEKFIVRVELHGIHHEHVLYTQLHETMKASGYIRSVVADDKSRNRLPSAMYQGVGQDMLKVRDSLTLVLKEFASNQLKDSEWEGKFELIVIPGDAWASFGLEIIEKTLPAIARLKTRGLA